MDRFVKVDDKVSRVSAENYRRALKSARDMQSIYIRLNPPQFEMQEVEDWTNLSSASAEALLAGMPADKVEILAEIQRNIEEDTPLLDVSEENLTPEAEPTSKK